MKIYDDFTAYDIKEFDTEGAAEEFAKAVNYHKRALPFRAVFKRKGKRFEVYMEPNNTDQASLEFLEDRLPSYYEDLRDELGDKKKWRTLKKTVDILMTEKRLNKQSDDKSVIWRWTYDPQLKEKKNEDRKPTGKTNERSDTVKRKQSARSSAERRVART